MSEWKFGEMLRIYISAPVDPAILTDLFSAWTLIPMSGGWQDETGEVRVEPSCIIEVLISNGSDEFRILRGAERLRDYYSQSAVLVTRKVEYWQMVSGPKLAQPNSSEVQFTYA